METNYFNLQDITARRNFKKKQNLISNWILIVGILFGSITAGLHFLANSSFLVSGKFFIGSLFATATILIFWYFYMTKNFETYVKINVNSISWKYKAWGNPTVLPWNTIKDIEKDHEDLLFHLQNGKCVKMGLTQQGKTTCIQIRNRIFSFCKSENMFVNSEHFKKAVTIYG